VDVRVGKDAEAGAARAFFENLDAIDEERRVAAEAVDGEAADQRAFGGFEQAERADDGGEDAAAIDVGDQQGAGVDALGKAEVDQIARLEIQFGDGAGALNDDDLEALGELLIGGEDVLQEFVEVFVVSAGGEVTPDAAVDDDL
jgi:hypothetical protein